MQTTILILTYIRAFLHWFWLSIITAFFVIMIIFFELVGKKKISYQISRLWAFGLLWFCGIKVIGKNKQNIPEKPFLMLFNHRSYIDIPALLQVTPERLHFGAKRTLFSIPIFGFGIKMQGHIPIHRENPRKVYKLYQSLSTRVQRGDCFALSPEGGRHTGPGLARFKKGPFIFATTCQIRILPVLIHKSEECMPKGSWFFNIGAWRRKVIVEYLPVIETKGK
ncbi:MAG: lysophospholipid acyltransferase family protein, partial [Bdellovibrionales bacterium]|nr:lysophospholipid acyltransferase family protein [Bdellovibrionales bacterium]